MNYLDIKKELLLFSNKEKAQHSERFFKTGKGEYGEGEKFLGATVPEVRLVSKKFSSANFDILEKLLKSSYHEERLLALLILVNQFEKADEKQRQKIFDFYLKNRKGINNWDLVDLSCYKIVGVYLLDKPKDILYKYAKSENLWERRISIVSTYYFIKNNIFDDTITIAEILLEDKHNLIHKAVGWMLREIGKKDVKILQKFLQKNSGKMPRTMLRYSIEKFAESERKKYLSNQIKKTTQINTWPF